MRLTLPKKYARPLIASITLVGGFAFVMRAGALPVLPPEGTLARLDWWPATWFLVAMFATMLAKYARIHFLMDPVAQIPMRRIMNISAIAMALITLLPLRLGEVARPAMLRERGAVVREGASFVFIYYVTHLGVVFSLALGALLLEYAMTGARANVPVSYGPGEEPLPRSR